MTTVTHFVLLIYVIQNCVTTQEILECSNKPSCQKYSAIKEYIDKQLWKKQNQLDTLLQKLDSQEKKVSKQQEQIDNMTVLLRKYESDLSHQQDLLQEYEERLNLSMKGTKVPEIGFTARFENTGSVGADGVMIFDTIITNYGNRYNRTTGRFTCNKSGLYIFSVIILSLSSANTYASIAHNGKLLNLVATFSQYENASGIVMVQLDVGDNVWIKSDSTFKIYAHSFFSGGLVST